jgi:DNA-binding CsgD family transcriptional regulator
MTERDHQDMTGVVIRSHRETFLVLSVPQARLDLSILTPAQRAIVADVVFGCSNAEVARLRRRSIRTVANHLAAIFRKLGVGSRGELVARIAAEEIKHARYDPAALRDE